ncbi:MAG: HTH domain-containing protein [Oscillospiraceae bacterium]|nr:HTH domain-containing protein [Oscillospiraceae bacterium]
MAKNIKYTFNKLIEEVLTKSNTPLTPNDIWDYALQNGQAEKLGSIGKTPQATIAARLYGDIKYNSNNGIFIQVSKRPSLFGIKNIEYDDKIIIAELEETKSEIIENFNERDLHPLLVAFVRSNPHFLCYTKTIYHEKSIKRQKGYNEWLHPDVVGVQFPFEEYKSKTLELIESLKNNPHKIFSFEMKIELNFKNIREFYFQALSNSSWANEGYLVTLKLEKDPDFIDEIRRLNNAFGIGVIQLDPINIEQSEIVLTSKAKDILDWDTINRLVEDSPDFDQFVQDIIEDIEVKKVKSKYDEVFSEEKLRNYISTKGIRS